MPHTLTNLRRSCGGDELSSVFMNIKEDFKKMTEYEKWKITIDFLRFVATLGAPFMIVILSHMAKKWLNW